MASFSSKVRASEPCRCCWSVATIELCEPRDLGDKETWETRLSSFLLIFSPLKIFVQIQNKWHSKWGFDLKTLFNVCTRSHHLVVIIPDDDFKIVETLNKVSNWTPYLDGHLFRILLNYFWNMFARTGKSRNGKYGSFLFAANFLG